MDEGEAEGDDQPPVLKREDPIISSSVNSSSNGGIPPSGAARPSRDDASQERDNETRRRQPLDVAKLADTLSGSYWNPVENSQRGRKLNHVAEAEDEVKKKPVEQFACITCSKSKFQREINAVRLFKLNLK